ncbi:MAG TPA: AbrB family transcriptional regulator [Bacillota bacterium]|nr:AbrB family transcriptional regulator [Bacillota bacterium]
MYQYLSNKYGRFIITLIVAIIGGMFFKLLHIPVPWLLGPMIIMVLGKNVLKWHLTWHDSLRDTGMVIVGYTIGLSMTTAALREMANQLPSMLLLTLLLMLWCAGIAYVVSRLSNTDFQSALLGSIPGGLTQVVVLAEETKGINLAVVTVTQVIRLMIIVISMPLLVSIPIFNQSTAENMSTSAASVAESAPLFPNIVFFAVVCIAFAVIGNKINFPTAYLLGPLIATVLLQLAGLNGPHLPAPLINVAQLMIGTHIGLMLETDQIDHKARSISLAIGSGLMLMLGSILLAMLLTGMHHVTKATALLSLAPGGMDQMSIIAHAIGADLSIVSGYQLFRTFSIFFAVPPLLKWLFKVMGHNKEHKKRHVTPSVKR